MSGGRTIIVLDAVEPGVMPDYCVHGKTPCVGCDDWCWLGDASFDVVMSGRAFGLCTACAIRFVPPGIEPVDRVHDSRRAGGSHAT